jgi:hypothetical protein
VARRKRWSDLSPAAKSAIVVGGVVEIAITTVALRDVITRPAREVRGPKLLWMLGFVVQPFGPLLYLRVGRRRRASEARA